MFVLLAQTNWTDYAAGQAIGIVVGVVTGLLVNLAWQKFVVDKQQRAEDSEQRHKVLRVLQSSLMDNQRYMRQIRKMLDQRDTPFFSVDVVGFVHTSHLRYTLLSVEICREIDVVRFELDHVGRKLDRLLKYGTIQENTFDGINKCAFSDSILLRNRSHSANSSW